MIPLLLIVNLSRHYKLCFLCHGHHQQLEVVATRWQCKSTLLTGGELAAIEVRLFQFVTRVQEFKRRNAQEQSIR